MASSDRLQGFLGEIDSAATMKELGAKTIAVIKHFRLTATASGIITGSRAATADRFHFVFWPEGLLARYVRENFQASDPGPRWARGTGTPATWTEILRRLPQKDPGRKTLQAAAEFGLKEGIVVPMRTADGAIGIITFGGDRPAIKPSEFHALLAIATSAFRTAERIDHSVDRAQAAPILTTREIELLPFLVHGHSDREIAQLNGIAEATVRFHLKNARLKTGAVSRTHLAAKVVALGFVSL